MTIFKEIKQFFTYVWIAIQESDKQKRETLKAAGEITAHEYQEGKSK